jgi:hypothetical protein
VGVIARRSSLAACEVLESEDDRDMKRRSSRSGDVGCLKDDTLLLLLDDGWLERGDDSLGRKISTL